MATNSYTAVITNESPATQYDISEWIPYSVDSDGSADTFKAATTSVTTGGSPIGTSPAAPKSLSAALGANPLTVFLHWQNTPNNETGFILQECPNVDFLNKVTDVGSFGTDITSYNDTNLTLGTMYFRVKAVNGNVASSWTYAQVLVHYNIKLQFNAFIPTTLGTPSVPPQPFNWAPEPFQLYKTIYFGTDDRATPGTVGTSRIHTEVDVDTSALGNSAQRTLFSAGADVSHQTHTGAFPAVNPANINVKRGTINSSESTNDPLPYSTDITVHADGAYPFAPFAPKIILDIVWHLKITTGTTVAVSITGKTTKFPAFEALVDHSVIWSISPPAGAGPGFNNLGDKNENSPVNGATTVTH